MANATLHQAESDQEDTATVNDRSTKEVDLDSASLSIDRVFGIVDALYTLKCSGGCAEELCEGSEIALLDAALMELRRAKSAIDPTVYRMAD